SRFFFNGHCASEVSAAAQVLIFVVLEMATQEPDQRQAPLPETPKMTVWDSPPLPGLEERHHSALLEQDSDDRDRFKNTAESKNYKPSVGSRSATQNRFSFAFCSSKKEQAVVLEREINKVDGER
ncbi:hypothetical protein U1Q18_044587, partial [Sarracenia purpurea var. burkii]